MTKLSKSSVTIGNEANAQALRDIADKMEAGSVSAYAVVVLENKGFKIDVTMKSGVMEHDEGMYHGALGSDGAPMDGLHRAEEADA